MDELRADPAWYEREYNPRLTVPETADLLAAWTPRSEKARREIPFLADLPTGEHPRERADLFRAAGARGCVVHIHGGYFRSFSKFENAFVAEGFVGQQLSVALLGYPLCPEVTLEELIASVRRSFARLVADVLTPEERRAVVVTGHSAGGYLAAALVATDWRAYGLDPAPFVGAVPVSGMFDLAPLMHTTMNEHIRLTPDRAPALDLTRMVQRVPVHLVAAFGAREPGEFHRQSEALAAAWSAPRPTATAVPGTNHFTVLDELTTPGRPLNRTVVDLARPPG